VSETQSLFEVVSGEHFHYHEGFQESQTPLFVLQAGSLQQYSCDARNFALAVVEPQLMMKEFWVRVTAKGTITQAVLE
jgi:hypothetical protein